MKPWRHFRLGDVTMDYPREFERVDLAGVGLALAMKRPMLVRESFRTNLVLMSERTSLGLEQMSFRAMEAEFGLSSTAHVVDCSFLPMNWGPGRQITYLHERPDGSTVTARKWVWVRGGSVVLLTASAYPEQFLEYERVFEAVASTIKFTGAS